MFSFHFSGFPKIFNGSALKWMKKPPVEYKLVPTDFNFDSMAPWRRVLIAEDDSHSRIKVKCVHYPVER